MKILFLSLPIHFSTCLLCFLVRLQKLIFLFSPFSFPLEKILHGDMCCHPDCNRCPDHLFKHKLKMMKTADALFYYLLPYHMKKKKILHTHILWFDKPPYFLLSSPNYFCFCYLYYYYFFYDYLCQNSRIARLNWLRILQSLFLKKIVAFVIYYFLLPKLFWYFRWLYLMIKYRGKENTFINCLRTPFSEN